MKTKQHPGTLCVQAGWTPKKGEPRVLPIYQSTTFKYDNSEQMARLFDLEDSGYFYTRLQNPTNDAVASKSFVEATFTTVAVWRRLVSLRVADTTTSSIVSV